MDIFDLVSGMQKEAIKEEKLEKEKKRELKERRRVKEVNRGKDRDKEADREKGKDNKEVLRRKEGGFEFHIDIMCLGTCAIDVLLSFHRTKSVISKELAKLVIRMNQVSLIGGNVKNKL